MSSIRIAAEITVDASDLTPNDLDELQARIEEAAAPWKAAVTVSSREYETEA